MTPEIALAASLALVMSAIGLLLYCIVALKQDVRRLHDRADVHFRTIRSIDDCSMQQTADIKKHRNMIVADREEIKDIDRRLNIQLAMVHEHQKQIERLFAREYVIVDAERWRNTVAAAEADYGRDHAGEYDSGEDG